MLTNCTEICGLTQVFWLQQGQSTGLSVHRFLSNRFHPKSRQLFPLYFSNITLRTDPLTFGVVGTVFRIGGEMWWLLAYFDNPESIQLSTDLLAVFGGILFTYSSYCYHISGPVLEIIFLCPFKSLLWLDISQIWLDITLVSIL